jgi:hypothetical protein
MYCYNLYRNVSVHKFAKTYNVLIMSHIVLNVAGLHYLF